MQGQGVWKHPPRAATEVATATNSIPGQQLLCRESRMLLGKVLSTNSFIGSRKLSVQDESSGGQMTWAAPWHGGPVPSLQQGTTSCSLFTRVRQHDACPLSKQRSALPVSDNGSTSCLGTSVGITVWLEAQGQAQSCTSVRYPPSVYPEIALAALFRAA